MRPKNKEEYNAKMARRRAAHARKPKRGGRSKAGGRLRKL